MHQCINSAQNAFYDIFSITVYINIRTNCHCYLKQNSKTTFISPKYTTSSLRYRTAKIRTRNLCMSSSKHPQLYKSKFHTIYNANYALENAKLGTETRGNNWWKEESELMKLASITGGKRNWHACSRGQWWNCW